MKNENRNVEHLFRTLAIVWGVLLLSQFMFIFVLMQAKPELFKFDWTAPILDENAIFVVAFAMMAVFNLVLSFIIKKRCYEQAVAEQKPSLVQTGLVIACAFCEAISLFGMVLAFAFSYQYFFAWFALGIFGILLHFPRRADLIAASYKQK